MQPKNIDDYTVVAVSFATLNINQETIDVSYQIVPDELIADDLRNDFSPRELNIAAALQTELTGKSTPSENLKTQKEIQLTSNALNLLGSIPIWHAIKQD